MGSKEGKKTNTIIDQERQRQLGESQRFQNTMEPERMAEKTFADSLRGDIVSGYKSLGAGAEGGTNYYGGGGGAGAEVPLDAIYGELEPRYRDLSKNLEAGAAGYQKFADTAGLTDENRARIRGKGVFDEVAQSGGYSDADRANVRGRGIAPIGAFYGNLKNELGRRQNVQGGYGGGFDASAAKLARESAIAGSGAARNTELGLADSIRAGRMQGAGALSSAETGLAGLEQSGRLAGLGGLERTGQFGYGGLEGIASTRQAQSNRNASVAGANAAGSASDAAANERYRNQLKLQSLGGLESVYGSNPAELSRYDSALMGNRQLTGQQVGGNIDTRAQYNPNVSGWDKALQLGGSIAGAAAPFLPTGTGVVRPRAPLAGHQSYPY